MTTTTRLISAAFAASFSLAQADTVLLPGQKLVVEFTLPAAPDPSADGLYLWGSTGGAGASGAPQFVGSLYDGGTLLAAPVARQTLTRSFIGEGSSHPNPFFPIQNMAPILDGSIQGKLVLEIPADQSGEATIEGDLSVRVARFESTGGFVFLMDATITSAEVVSASDPEDLRVAAAWDGANHGLTLSWNSTAATRYQIWESPDLEAWSPRFEVTANGPSTSFTVAQPEPLPAAMFYRVEELD